MLESWLLDIGITISVQAYTMKKKKMEQTRIKEYISQAFVLLGLNTYAATKEIKGEKIVNLPIPTTHAMRIIIQFKTFFFSSIIVVDIHSFIYPLQNISPSRNPINFLTNL